ncbi:MAG: rod shape-determining protein RodA [Gammaproteobacteria bacterium]|nr:rod shape-determining protein RodA [Gammaproteobacteria bacterium]
MKKYNLTIHQPYQSQGTQTNFQKLWHFLHIDIPLLVGILLLITMGLFILYSASNQNTALIIRQATRMLIALGIMFVLAQIPPRKYKGWAPWLFGLCLLLLLAVLGIGAMSKGAQRWLNLGLFSFQPSEIMKLAVPMMLAWYLSDKRLPPDFKTLLICGAIILVPVVATAKQPDLGTALIIAIAGIFVLLLAGISWKLVTSTAALLALCFPIVWHFMHSYQRARVLTFLNPERDPLGSGYHIIQSKIAIGSGGLLGKGWLHGTQSHLHFLPEHATDFIFAVCSEEFGLIGCLILLAILLYIIGRGLYISSQAQDTFTRLLAGSLTLTFFLSFFVNIGMVTGILPVVGLPLPLISYGGSSIVTLMAGFGIIMSIHTHRKLVTS